MLVLEIAGGVFIGLLFYRGLDTFCKNRNVTMPAGIFLLLWPLLATALTLGSLGLLLFYSIQAIRFENGKLVIVVTPEAKWITALVIILGVAYAIWSDAAGRKKSPEYLAEQERLRQEKERLRLSREVYDADWLRSVPKKWED